MDVAAGQRRAGLVELFNQAAHLGHAGRVGRAQDQAVGAGFGHHRGFEAVVGGIGRSWRAPAGTGFEQARDQRGQLAGQGVLEHNHLDVAGVGHVQCRDDAAQALQVVGVVGDDQRVVAGVDVDGVVGADQRAQHRHQVIGVFKIEFEDVRHHLTGGCRCRRWGAAGVGHFGHAAALQFGLGLGHHFI